MIDIFAAEERRDEHPGSFAVLDVEIVRESTLHVAHDVGDRVVGGGFEDPVAVVVHERKAVNADAVEGGVFAHIGEGLLEVLGIAVDPLSAVAALGDGVELLGAEVARFAHAGRLARHGPKSGGESLQWVAGGREEGCFKVERMPFQKETNRFTSVPREGARHFWSLLHELLHTLGYSDKYIQTTFLGKVDPKNTNNITEYLGKHCFKN